MIEHAPWWSPLVGYALGWLAGRLDRETRDDPRRRFNHENRHSPVGPPPLKFKRGANEITLEEWEAMRTPPPVRLDEGRVQRSNGSGSTTTPKPNIVPKPQHPHSGSSPDTPHD